MLKLNTEKLIDNNIDHCKESIKILQESINKEYYFFKMNIQPNITKNINKETIEFLCELIDKEHLYIEELLKKCNNNLNKKKNYYSQNKNIMNNSFLNLNIFLTKNNLNESTDNIENINKNNKLKKNNLLSPYKKINISQKPLNISISAVELIKKNDKENKKIEVKSHKKSKSINVYEFNEINKNINNKRNTNNYMLTNSKSINNNNQKNKKKKKS